MRINEIIVESQELDELSLQGVKQGAATAGRAVQTGLRGVGKAAGYVAGIPQGIGRAAAAGYKSAVSGIGGPAPTGTPPAPTPAPTGTPPAPTPAPTGTPPAPTPTPTGTPPAPTPTGTPPAPTPTGTPPAPTPTGTPTNQIQAVKNLGIAWNNWKTLQAANRRLIPSAAMKKLIRQMWIDVGSPTA